MQADSPRPNVSTRLRLIALTSDARETEFGGGLACVPVDASARSAIANAIATAVIGPRPAGMDGTIEIAGRYVSLQSLPAPLLRPSATPTVDRQLLDDLWQEVCTQRRSKIEAAHASRRLLRHRTAAALERARLRAEELAARPLAPPPVALVPEPEPVVPEPEPEPDVDEITPRLVACLDALAELVGVPSPEALTLADAFDELAARPDIVLDDIVDVDLPAIEARVATARLAVAHAVGGVRPEARVEIEQTHRMVVDAESALFEARRKERPEALAAYQKALAAEHAALDAVGVDSYASFLITTAQGAAPTGAEERLRAEIELASAEAELHSARALLAGPDSDREEELLGLRAQAAQLLGHFPGEDATAELRALRVEHPDAAILREELREVLRSIGEDPGVDVVGRAVAVLELRESPPVAVVPDPEPEPVVPATAPGVVVGDPLSLAELDPELAEEQLALHNETFALTDELAKHDRALGIIEGELAYADRVRAVDIAAIDVDALDLLLEELFECYRAGDLLAGRLPLVIDGAFDDLGAASASAVATRLGALYDVQVIVVTSDPELLDALGTVGAVTVAWPDAPGHVPHPRPPGPGAEIPDIGAPVVVNPTQAFCATHRDKPSATSCSQCAKPSCLDCLVYVPGEPELWCVACAEAMRSRNLRLLRRRGA